MIAAIANFAVLGLQLGGAPAPQAARASQVSMQTLNRPIKVAVIGGGPSGACAAEIFAQVSCPLSDETFA